MSIIFADVEPSLIEMQTLPFCSRSPPMSVKNIISKPPHIECEEEMLEIHICHPKRESEVIVLLMKQSTIDTRYLFETELYDHRWFEMKVVVFAYSKS
jgi:hypothetical protein